jgi:S-adenosylmethionine:tRNA ribosyltransferase-isomerase
MVYPGDSFPIGARVQIGNFEMEVRAITYQGRTFALVQGGDVMEMLARYGTYPIPPYIASSEEALTAYQTDFATHPGSLAAPTASLHFSQSLLEQLREGGVTTRFATLHVGIGTFKVVNESDIRNHVMHPEPFLFDGTIFESIALAKMQGHPVLAVGTTMVRYLESLPFLWKIQKNQQGVSSESRAWWNNLVAGISEENSPVRIRSEYSAETSIFIYEGHQFQIVDEIITNFHLPESTLLAMIGAFV